MFNDTYQGQTYSYKEGYVESDIVSRTYIVEREHNLPIISINEVGKTVY